MNTVKVVGTELYQWEIGRKVRIYPNGKLNVAAVHFSHVGDVNALVVDPNHEDGVITAHIPNILLQSDANIVVYIVDVSEDRVETLRECVLGVNRRAKPADYVYTEEELRTYDALEKRIRDLEEGGSGGIAQESDPTVPAWAKEPNKPKYTAEEVGAASTEDVARLSEEIGEINNTLNDLPSGLDNIIETVQIPTKNLLNPAELKVGYYVFNGREDANANYSATGYIAVAPGDVVTASWVNASGVQSEMHMRYISLYDADKNLVAGGGDVKASTYVVPSGVYFMRISIYTKTHNTQTLQIEITDDGIYTPYAPYGETTERRLADDIIVPEVKSARGDYDNLGDRLDAMTAKADWGLNLPPTLYALVGEELNVYFDNIVTQGRDVDYEWDVTCSIGQQMERGYTVVPTEAGEYAISIKCSKNGMSVQAESKIVASAANQGDGVTRSMIILGDSTTNNSNATLKIAENFETDPMSLSLLGTRGTAPRNHEGRSGWKFSQYHTMAVDAYDGAVVNPFFNPETSKFDAAYYFANTGVAIPDYFVINLGINDMFGYADDASAESGIATNTTYLDATIASVRSAAPNTKICVALTIPPNYSQDAFGKAYKCSQTRDRYKRNNALWVTELIETYQGRESDGIYLLPIHTNLDTRYNMGLEAAQVNKRNSETYQQPIANGGVHPVESGYWQIADVYWFFLKSFET